MARANNGLSAEQQLANIRAKRAEQARKWREKNPEKFALSQLRAAQRKVERLTGGAKKE